MDGASHHRLASPRSLLVTRKAGLERQPRRSTAPAALATREHDVLAIDMDPQADMTKGLGLGPGDDNDPSSPKNELPNTLVTDDENLLDVLVDNPRTHDTSLSEIMIEADEYDHLNFDLIPSHKDMGLARDWMDDASARLSLKLALEEMVDDGYNYDYIVVDCPPDLSVLTDAAFIAAQNVFLAAQTQATSRDALDDLWDQLESIEDNQQIEIDNRRTPGEHVPGRRPVEKFPQRLRRVLRVDGTNFQAPDASSDSACVGQRTRYFRMGRRERSASRA